MDTGKAKGKYILRKEASLAHMRAYIHPKSIYCVSIVAAVGHTANKKYKDSEI